MPRHCSTGKKKKQGAPRSFRQAFGMPVLDTPTPADEEQEISLASHIIFLQENRSEIPNTSNGPYL